MSKLKPSKAPKPETVKPAPEAAPQPLKFMPWPLNPKELGSEPRSFRIHRLNSFEWQAYVIDAAGEQLIGKPDLIDIVIYKLKGLMRAEGQREFLENKTKTAVAVTNEA